MKSKSIVVFMFGVCAMVTGCGNQPGLGTAPDAVCPAGWFVTVKHRHAVRNRTLGPMRTDNVGSSAAQYPGISPRQTIRRYVARSTRPTSLRTDSAISSIPQNQAAEAFGWAEAFRWAGSEKWTGRGPAVKPRQSSCYIYGRAAGRSMGRGAILGLMYSVPPEHLG